MTVVLVITIIIAAGAAARAAFMLSCRTAVLATRFSHPYSQESRHSDDSFYVLDLAKRNITYGPSPKDGNVRVDYSYNGNDYRKDVRVWGKGGTEPEGSITLWIDPQNPNNVTAQGPVYWSSIAALFAFAAALTNHDFNSAVKKISCAGEDDRAQCSDLQPMAEQLLKRKQ